ncbi:MAG: methionyl-tRNA formyltransferase [Spirochaetales bacterium]
MRILFAATPSIAVPALEALVSAGYRVAVLTNPPAPTGRGGRLTPSEIDQRASVLGLEVIRAEKLDAAVRTLLDGRFDLLISFAFGKIFGPKFLALFPQGGLNVHPSLLPRWRGPSPLSAALAAGDTETGLSIQKLALEMDTGDVVLQRRLPLGGHETTASLTLWAADAAASALVDTLAALPEFLAKAVAQDSNLATYCHLVQKADGRLDWTRSARELDALVRACNPWPGAFTMWNGQKLTIWDSRVYDAVGRTEAPYGDNLSRTEAPYGASVGSKQSPPGNGRTEAPSGASVGSKQSPPGNGRTEAPSGASVGSKQSPPGTVLSLDKESGILVKTGDGFLVVRELQLPARKSLDYRSFVNGSPGLIGSLLGDTP